MEVIGMSEDVLFDLVTVAQDGLVGRFLEVLRGLDVKVGLFDLNLKGDQA